MNKLDQKIQTINAQILKLSAEKSDLIAMELDFKGGEGSGRYPSGSGAQEKISETPKPYYPVTDKSQYVRDGLSSTSHEVIDVNIKQGASNGYDVVQVETESRDPNAPKGETTTLTVQIFSQSDANGDVAELRIDKVQDPDRNEVGTSPAFDKILQANIRDAIATHNEYYKNTKKHMSKLDQKIDAINAEILELVKRKSALLAIKEGVTSGTKGGEGSGRYPAGSSSQEKIDPVPKTNPVTAKSEAVKDGMATTSHEISNFNLGTEDRFGGGPNFMFEGEHTVIVEVQNFADANLTDAQSLAKLSVKIDVSEADDTRSATADVLEVTDADGNEVAMSDAFMKTMDTFLSDAVDQNNEAWADRQRENSY